MADIAEVEVSSAGELLSLGRRHLVVRDYSSAVASLGKACEMLVSEHGQLADQCGEAYFWYGKSLLGLAREESGVLGDGIPQGGEENQEDEEEEDEDDDDNNEDTDANKGDEEKTEDGKESKQNGEKTAEPEKPSGAEAAPTEAVADKQEEKVENKSEEKVEGKDAEKSSGDVEMADTSSKSDQDKPSSSTAGPASEEEVEAEEEDEVENLQLAWEVLELARDIFLRRGDRGKKELADVYLQLGEVSLESETYDKAVSDMTKSLELFKELYNPNDRRIAETHYQIGLAHSLSNGFDSAISNFRSAAAILEARIKNLEAPETAAQDPDVKKNLAADSFYSVEGEIKELKELLPEIQEKIADMIDYKAEAIKSVRESLGLPPQNGKPKENGTASSSAEEPKKAVDISHLVRRKRKPSEELADEVNQPAKKQAPSE